MADIFKGAMHGRCNGSLRSVFQLPLDCPANDLQCVLVAKVAEGSDAAEKGIEAGIALAEIAQEAVRQGCRTKERRRTRP